MKRYVLLILVAILTSGIAMAQNANRSGFFLETGIGGLVGNTPRSSISISNNIMYYKCLSGAAFDFGFGGRVRMNNHWAYEFKAEANMPLSNPIQALVARALPIGFRYTSPEIWRNYSLYSHFNLGGAIVVNRGIMSSSNNIIYPDTEEFNIHRNGYGEGYGVAYSLGIGANITNHFYAEACLNAQVIFDALTKNGIGITNYGVLAFQLGYRF